MGLLLTLIAGLVVWIVLWALGIKGFDAFMITVLMVLVAAGLRIVWPMLPGNRNDRDSPLTGRRSDTGPQDRAAPRGAPQTRFPPPRCEAVACQEGRA